MTIPHQSTTMNGLLRALSSADFDLLAASFETVPLGRHDVLAEPGQPHKWVLFPESGLGSVVAISPEDHLSEVGMFGRDGLAGTPLLLGTDRSAQKVLIQSDGTGWRIAAAPFGAAIAASRTLHGALLRYVQTMITQSAHTALSNATHTVEERLARWLLMCHDRTDGDELGLTHEFLGTMLAVRRPTVTTALHILEGMDLIRNVRARVHIRDRAGLETLAADAYGIPEREYERLIGPLRKAPAG